MTATDFFPPNGTIALPSEPEGLPSCGDSESYTLARFLFLFGSSWIALLGIIGNALLVYLFACHRNPNTPPTLYPSVLAVLDALICAMYILLFGADAVIGYLHWKNLFTTYHIYIVPAFVVSRITQLSIPWVLILGTLERFVWTVRNMRSKVLRSMYSHQGRVITMLFTLSFCILLRLPTFWAITVYDFPDCKDFFRTKTTSVAEWVPESVIYHVYDFHLLSIAQTVVPFIVLLSLNVIIVKRLAKLDHADAKEPSEYSNALPMNNEYAYGLAEQTGSPTETNSPHLLPKRRVNAPVKSAIYTMVAIVTSYLLSNSLHLILTGLERSNSDLLRDPEDPNMASTFHTAFSDTVSFVYMFTSAIRIAIYYFCNQTIRVDVQEFLKQLFARVKKPTDEITSI